MIQKTADSAYFRHNGGQTTMSQKGKVDFFEIVGIILIIFEVKPSIQKGWQLAPRVHVKYQFY